MLVDCLLTRWDWGKASSQGLSGGGQAEAGEDLSLTCAGARCHDDGADSAVVHQHPANAEVAQQRLGGAALFAKRCVGRHA